MYNSPNEDFKYSYPLKLYHKSKSVAMITAKFKPSIHVYLVFKCCLATQTEVIYHLEN